MESKLNSYYFNYSPLCWKCYESKFKYFAWSMNMLKCEFTLPIIKRIHVKINYNCAHASKNWNIKYRWIMHIYLLNLLFLIIWKFNVFKYNSNDQVNTYVWSKDEIKHKHKWWYPPVTLSTLKLWQTPSHYEKWQVRKNLISSFNHLQIKLFDE